MPGPVLTQIATVLCAHGGQARPTSTLPRVLLSGAPGIAQSIPYVVTACPFNDDGTPSPCVTVPGPLRPPGVRSGGIPLLLRDSQGVCAPNGPPCWW